MASHLTLTHKHHVCDNIWAFRFTPDALRDWIAGQYISVELPHEYPDGEGTRRWFTISSAPYEGFIEITTRITHSTFKQALLALPLGGTMIMLDEPHGTFTWQDVDKPLVFVAGGIGITTFRSILRQRAHDGLPLTARLIYATRTPVAVFKDELDAYAALDSSLDVTYLVGQRCSASLLAELVPDITQSIVYLSGPGSMVRVLGMDLEGAALPPAQLKVDAFPSYTDQTC